MELATILDFIIKGILAISQLALFIYVRNATRNDKVDERFIAIQQAQKADSEKHSGEIVALLGRLAHLETAVSTAPSHEDLSGIHEKINKIGEGLYSLGGKFDGVNTLLQTIHRHLLERS